MGMCVERATHITSKVLLLSQDGLVPIKLALNLNDELLHVLLVRSLPEHRLENFLVGDFRRDRIKLRILDARRLLELGTGLGIGRNQLGARAQRRDVPRDGARLEQLKPVLLLKKTKTNKDK
jgi:hypothetical protein